MILGYVVGDTILNNFFLYMLPPLDLRFRDIREKLLLLRDVFSHIYLPTKRVRGTVCASMRRNK